jgi:hypothetical protein
MSGCCDEEIFSCHAALIHSAAEIQFALAYLNGTIPATITDIDKRNVQQVLEEYFSIHGIPVIREYPIGLKNSINLTFATEFEFVAGTLEVFLSGMSLIGKPTDPNRDFDVHLDNKGFTIRVEPMLSHRLNKPPKQRESLTVNYRKRITFNTKGGN